MNQSTLQKKILAWYKQHKRDLPWRQTTDPYKIWVSEIMLQQTQVDRVVPKYLAFLNAFPTVQRLAKAPTAEILKLWSGLGYNSRALRLQKAAQIITDKHKGKIIPNRELLMALPGIGSYTANAILSFAFNLPYPCIDTNIRRILIHELQLPEKITEKELYDHAEKIIPKGKSCEWHNALMDYGSSILTVKKTGIKPLSKQSKFLYSRRWYRGQIMKLLVKNESTTIKALGKAFKKDEVWTEKLVKEMQQQGLVEYKRKRVSLP